MNIFLDETELEEIKPIAPTEDKGLVINPEVGKRGEGNSDLVKEVVALDSILLGPSEAARINGVPQSSASKYADGKDIEDAETRTRIIATKNGIEDLAVTKLMETLNMLDPSDMEKPRDKIALMTGLSNLVEKVSSAKNEKEGAKQVHLHLYAPNQKQESHYKVIEA